MTYQTLRKALDEQWDRLSGTGIGAVLLRGAVAFFAIQLAGTALNFGLHVVLARQLGAEKYGRYAYVLNWMLVLLVPAKLGLDLAALRFVPFHAGRSEWGLLRGFLRLSWQVVLGASVVVSVVAIAAAELLGLGPETVPRATTVYLAAAMVPVHALAMLWSSVLRGLKRVTQSQAPLSVVYPLATIVGVVAWDIATDADVDATAAMGITFGASLLSLGLTAWSLRSALPIKLAREPVAFHVPAWSRVAGFMLLMTLLQTSVSKAGVLIVGTFSSVKEAGFYAAADRLSNLMQFGLLAVNSWAAPLIAELHGRQEHRDLQRMVRMATRVVVTVSLPMASVLVVGGKHLLGLFGNEFVGAYGVLVVLTGGLMVAAVTGPAGFLMTMTGNEREAAWVEGMTAGLNVGLTLVLVPTVGILGAAIAAATATAARNLWMVVLVRRRLDLRVTVL